MMTGRTAIENDRGDVAIKGDRGGLGEGGGGDGRDYSQDQRPTREPGKLRRIGFRGLDATIHRSSLMAAGRAAATTLGTVMAFMQRKSMGHSRRKHGAQGAGPRTICTDAEKMGPVSSGEVLPKRATTGAPTAAARCMGPVSLVKTSLQDLRRAASSPRVVFPARLMAESGAPLRWMSAAMAPARPASAAPPKTSQRQRVEA